VTKFLESHAERPVIKVQKGIDSFLDQARELVTDPRLAAALAVAVGTPALWVGNREGARRFLVEQGFEVSPDLEVRFTQEDPAKAPAAETSMTFRLVNRQTYWVAREDGSGHEQVTWCRGFEIVPRGEGFR
jgi:hypothetical protein